MLQAREAIARGRGRAEGAEIEAGAEALRLGVQGAQVSALAREAPADRSLAVPLYVVGSLIDRGLPADAALERVQRRLLSRASDVDLERLPAEVPPQAAAPGQARRAEGGNAAAGNAGPGSPSRPATAGQGPVKGAGKPAGRPGGVGGKPAGTPGGPPSGVPSAGAGKGKGKKPPKPDKP